jgi:uncharacterized membrane protein YheB (UPF0754 family)
MGTELKPITFLGALLGLIGGVGLNLWSSLSEMNLPLNTRLTLSLFVYGFIGYITNVIALKMIFRPYQEKYLFGLKLPFTPGVVAKNKGRFADSMAKFVGEELLEAQTVNQILQERREGIEERLKEVISQENYQLIDNYLIEHSDLISEKVYGYALQ